MYNAIIFIPILIITGVTSVIKLIDFTYKKKLEKFQEESQDTLDVVSEKVSYERFIKVAKESLRTNSPLRKQDDFLDFMVSQISENTHLATIKILEIDYGEKNE